MQAIFDTGVHPPLSDFLGETPWCLAPFAGKPLVEYWIEWAVSLNIQEVTLILGDGAYEIETYCGDGSRWGVHIAYGFLKDGTPRLSYLRRVPHAWQNGLLYICGPVFPSKTATDTTRFCTLPTQASWILYAEHAITCFVCTDGQTIKSLLANEPTHATAEWSQLCVTPQLVADIKTFYDLNMRLVKGENRLYVSQGYGGSEGASFGYNVRIPPSVELRPPFTIGNDCRFQDIAVIGPNVVIGNSVIVDRQTEIADSIILDGTYLGRNLEIKNKIVVGSTIISPESAVAVEISDPWLLSKLETPLRFDDIWRFSVGWLLAVFLVCLQAIPFVILYPWVAQTQGGAFRLTPRRIRGNRIHQLPEWVSRKPSAFSVRLFIALSLDCFPLFFQTVRGHLWLCGHLPLHPERDQALQHKLHRYFPAAIVYPAQTRAAYQDPATAMANALYYERYASLRDDLHTVFKTLLARLFNGFTE